MNAPKILLTRPAGQSGNLADLLRSRGAVPIICPALEIVQLIDDQGLRDAWSSWQAQAGSGLVVLTSARTVEFLVGARVNVDRLCAAVGPKTKQAALGAGWSCAPFETGDAESLAQELIRAGHTAGQIWLPCSKQADTTLQDALAKAGASVTRINLYEPRENTAQLLEIAKTEQAFEVIVFYSSSAVDATVDAIGAERLVGVAVVCIGRSTGSRAQQRGLAPAAVAAEPTDIAVLDAIDTVAPLSSIIGAI
jgi:uroporphyrinogen-III synthase